MKQSVGLDDNRLAFMSIDCRVVNRYFAWLTEIPYFSGLFVAIVSSHQ